MLKQRFRRENKYFHIFPSASPIVQYGIRQQRYGGGKGLWRQRSTKQKEGIVMKTLFGCWVIEDDYQQKGGKGRLSQMIRPAVMGRLTQ